VALTPGTRLGSFEISALIGVGGMGEVYRATDTSLKRPVAIKVLPHSLSTECHSRHTGASRNRMSLRKTGLIRTPQPSLSINEVCQNTHYGFAERHTVPRCVGYHFVSSETDAGTLTTE
jgi:serine/threonine protein kinase